MKFNFILLILLTFSVGGFSQSKNNVSVVYGIASNIVDIHGAIGDYGYNAKTGLTTGFTYTRVIRKAFSIETGLLFSYDKVELSSLQVPRGNVLSDGDVKMLSVPIYAKWTIFRYFFIDAGFSVDKQTNHSGDSVVDDQSGIGAGVGIGGKYTFSRVTIFVNPYLRQVSLIGFNNSRNNNLSDAGIKFGAGINF